MVEETRVRPGPAAGPNGPPARQQVMLVGVAIASYVVAVSVALVRGLNEWIIVDHVVSYRTHGFVRRGLVGTLTEPWIDDLDDVRVSFLVVSTIGAVALTALLARLVGRLDDDGQRWLVVALAAGLMTYLGWQPGRTDAIVLPLLVALWLWADEDGSAIVGALLLATVGLVHETGLAWGVAVVVGAIVADRLTRARAVAVMAAGVATGLVVVLAGGFDGSSDEFLARLSFPPPLADNLIIERGAPWTGSPADGLASVRVWLAQSSPVDQLVLPLVAVGCAVLLWRKVGAVVAAVTVAPAVVFALVGIDHLRWASLLLAVTALQLAFPRALPRLGRSSALAVAVLLVVVGPLGDTTVFPYWR